MGHLYLRNLLYSSQPSSLPFKSEFVILNLNKEAPRWIRGTGKSEESYSVNNDSGSHINDEESEINDKEELFEEEEDEQDEYRLDWMFLAEMGPKPNFDCSSDLESHYHNTFEGRQDEPLRIIVMGTAGTGKTYLIEAIRCRLREMAGGSKSPIAVLALTGVAAFNTENITIHSGLSILIVNNANCLDISGKRLKQLQDKLKDVDYLFSDFGQLPPVLDLPMYTDTK
ncbi:hypothetical protein RhiirB3_395914 [Rhizophagus irregularis]|nr:hypothetical protein RhiirB3_395914 [Rhizophagus irregularis]